MVSHIRIYYKQQGQTTWIIDSPWGRTLSPGARVDNWGRRPQFPTKKNKLPVSPTKNTTRIVGRSQQKIFRNFSKSKRTETRKAFVFIHCNTFWRIEDDS